MPEITQEVNTLIERVAAIESELTVLMNSAKSHEQSARDAWKEYFTLKEERKAINATLSRKQVVIATQNAQQAAQQAQAQAEATAKEAEKTLASLNEQRNTLAEKEAKLDALIAKAEAAK